MEQQTYILVALKPETDHPSGILDTVGICRAIEENLDEVKAAITVSDGRSVEPRDDDSMFVLLTTPEAAARVRQSA